MHSEYTASPRLTPPEHKGYPFFGVLPGMLRDGPDELLRMARRHPAQICASSVGPLRFYLVTHPDHVQDVLVDKEQNFGKGGMYRVLRRLLGDSLLTSEGDAWVRHRRVVQPLFTQKHLGSLIDIMAQIVADTIPRYAASAAAGVALDMEQEMIRLAEEIIMKTLFIGSGITRDESESLATAIRVAADTLMPRLFVSFLPTWFPLPGERALCNALATIDAIMLGLIRTPRTSGAAEGDLLSLLNAREDKASALDARQMRDHLTTLFVAGNLTTADTMTWLFYLLATHRDVEQKLRAEIAEVLGDRRPTMADLANLRYTRMVIQETLRLYPSAWFFPRFSKANDTIGGTAIPGGATLLLCPYATHRDPAFWPRPEVFDPERFLPERSAARPRFAYMPFGGGPHQCIGMQFALMEAQIIAAMLVPRFRFRLVSKEPVVPMGRSSLKPRHGLQLMLARV